MNTKPAVVIIRKNGTRFSAVEVTNGKVTPVHTAAYESAEAVKIEAARKLGKQVIFI